MKLAKNTATHICKLIVSISKAILKCLLSVKLGLDYSREHLHKNWTKRYQEGSGSSVAIGCGTYVVLLDQFLMIGIYTGN